MNLKECFEQQLAELEMLQSMYPTEREFIIEDPGAVAVVTRCVNDEIAANEVTSSISFSVKLRIDPKEQDCLELECHLPPSYPEHRLSFLLRSSLLSKSALKRITAELNAFQEEEVGPGDLCVTPLVAWLQENAEKIYSTDYAGQVLDDRPARATPADNVLAFNRLWIYSHHIYSQGKRKKILNSARDLSLSGFCMPGKPGVICVEGEAAATEEFWRGLRRQNWQRICLRGEEPTELDPGGSVDSLRRFEGFEEKFFKAERAASNDRHMDLGGLLEFLTSVGLPHIFQMYFGVEGRSAT